MKYLHQHPFHQVHQACVRACQGPITKKKKAYLLALFLLAMLESTPNTDFC